MNLFVTISFIQTIETIAFSRWTYLLLGGLFLIIFVTGVWLLMKPESSADQQSIATHDVKGEIDLILSKILTLEDTCKTVVFLSSSYEIMPVTLPVKTAIFLAHSMRKCLLIDLDTQRNAIGNVFEISGHHQRQKPITTPFKNLDIWPATFFEDQNALSIDQIIQMIKDNYDSILINSPNFENTILKENPLPLSDYTIILTETFIQFKTITHKDRQSCRDIIDISPKTSRHAQKI